VSCGGPADSDVGRRAMTKFRSTCSARQSEHTSVKGCALSRMAHVAVVT
jgi:hypothetical protein